MFVENSFFSAYTRAACLTVVLSILVVFCPGEILAQKKPLLPEFGSLSAPGQIETTADDIKYDKKSGWIDARGNVFIKKGNQSITADYVRVNMKTEMAYAYGNVKLKRGGELWTGERVQGNFKTGTWDAFEVTGGTDPFRLLEPATIKKQEDGAYVVHHGLLSTCTNDLPNCHYHVKAKSVVIYPEDKMKLRGVSWYFGNIPVFYAPFWNMSLDPEYGWRYNLGYGSRLGGYALTSYRYRLNPVFRGETHFDYYSRRGLGLGQDFKWNITNGYGNLEVYYIDDKNPIDDDEDMTDDIENQRYRVLFDHYQVFTDRDYLLVEANYLSDTDVLEDFFEDEFENGVQPENYASLVHREDLYVASLYSQWRMNDFFETITRVPEATIDFMPQQIGESFFYYEGQSSLAQLERLYEANNSTNQDYSSFRVDTAHLVYHPIKHFGFLNVNPRVGYRGTYYSATKESSTSSQVSTSSETTETIDSMGVTNYNVSTSLETNKVTTYTDGPAEYRSVFELGVEFSFKAFKKWGAGEMARRRIIEPYIDYTLIPEPDVLKADLYQFDKIDRIAKNHSVKIGTRNKYQRKRRGRAYDLVDVDIYANVRLEPEDDEEQIEKFVFDGELRPVNYLRIDFDAVYDMDESVIDKFNIRGTMMHSELVAYGAEFRHKEEESNLLYGDIMFYPNMPWTYTLYGRHEFEKSRLEEVGMYVQRNYDCMVVRVRMSLEPGYTRDDGTDQDDDFKVLLEMWLRDISSVKIGRNSSQGSGLLNQYINPELRGDRSSDYLGNSGGNEDY